MAQATFVQEGRRIDHTPVSAVVAGQVVVQGPLVGIANVPIAAGALGSLAVEGVFDVVQGAVTFTAGQAVYWDADGDPVGGTAGTGAAVESATGNTFMGFALAATEATDETVRVALRSIESSAAETLSLGDLGDVGAVAYTAGRILIADGDSYEDQALSGPLAPGELAWTSQPTTNTIARHPKIGCLIGRCPLASVWRRRPVWQPRDRPCTRS